MLEIRDLAISFQRNRGSFARETVSVVSDISLSVKAGEIVALIGASGAGKSLLALALIGLLPGNARMSGEFNFKGRQVGTDLLQELRGREIALIPQSVSYLNPLIKVRQQVYRSARLSGRCRDTASGYCDSAFARYHLKEAVKAMFPFQISGGMARRVLTATATAGKADLLIADEPTTGLDPTATEQSLHHIKELAAQGKGVVLITHDLASGIKYADTLVVLHNGRTVEITPARSLLQDNLILHPYTRSLWQALPQNGFISPDPAAPRETTAQNCCSFANCCPQGKDICRASVPPLRRIAGKQVRCFYAAG